MCLCAVSQVSAQDADDIALNDNMAFSCMDFCQKQLGLKIPEDIIITGFDDLNRASFFTPSLTTVNQHIELQGKMAAETLCKLIDKKEVPLLQTVNAEAVMRQSTNRIKDEKSSGKKQLVFDKELDLRCAVTEWYTRRTQVYRAAQFYSGMHYDIDLSRVGKLLTSELIQFGFESFAIVVYENPIEQLYPFEYFNLPQKAFLSGGLKPALTVQKKILILSLILMKDLFRKAIYVIQVMVQL